MKINDTIDGMGIPENEFVNADIPEVAAETSAEQGFSMPIKEIIFCPTGPDDDYVVHPLNFAKSEGLGQIIKGVTGYLQHFANVSSLKLALLDVIFGWLKFQRELQGGKTE